MFKRLAKQKKVIIICGAVLALGILLHFMPIDSRTGYIHNEWCISQTPQATYNYRWISGDINEWDDEMSAIQPSSSECKLDQVVHVRLYAL
jgi:hypothetical protein